MMSEEKAAEKVDLSPPPQTGEPSGAKATPPAVEKTSLLQGGNVVVTQPAVQSQPKFKDFPVNMVDDKGNRFTTEVRFVNGLFTWVAVGVICLVAGAFGLPCVGLLPLCIKSFKDVEHVNPLDGSVVGKYDRGADLGLK